MYLFGASQFILATSGSKKKYTTLRNDIISIMSHSKVQIAIQIAYFVGVCAFFSKLNIK